jgi:hypothetical protein
VNFYASAKNGDTLVAEAEKVRGKRVGFYRLRVFRGNDLIMEGGTELEFVIMVIAVSCVKLLSAHNSTQHTSRKHKV